MTPPLTDATEFHLRTAPMWAMAVCGLIGLWIAVDAISSQSAEFLGRKYEDQGAISFGVVLGISCLIVVPITAKMGAPGPHIVLGDDGISIRRALRPALVEWSELSAVDISGNPGRRTLSMRRGDGSKEQVKEQFLVEPMDQLLEALQARGPGYGSPAPGPGAM